MGFLNLEFTIEVQQRRRSKKEWTQSRESLTIRIVQKRRRERQQWATMSILPQKSEKGTEMYCWRKNDPRDGKRNETIRLNLTKKLDIKSLANWCDIPKKWTVAKLVRMWWNVLRSSRKGLVQMSKKLLTREQIKSLQIQTVIYIFIKH